jgi:hypothetical protein
LENINPLETEKGCIKLSKQPFYYQTTTSKTLLLMRFISLLTLLSLSLTSCSCGQIKRTKKEEEMAKKIVILNLEEAMKKPRELKLSDFIEKIEYIKLNTKEENLISQITDIKTSKHFLYLQQEGEILQYNKTGKLIRSLFKMGRGPGECFCRTFDIDENTNQLYVYSNFKHRIEIYSESGKYLKSIPDNNPALFFTDRMYIANKKLLFTSHISQKIPNKFLCAYNITDNTLQYSFANQHNYIPQKRIRVVTSNIVSLQKTNDSILFKEKYNDTLFTTKNFNFLEAKYIIDFGSRKRSFKEEMNINSFSIPINFKTYVLERFHESERFLFLNISRITKRSEKQELVIYDKSTDKLLYSDDLFIRNDIDGGLTFKAFNTLDNWTDGEKLYFPIQAIDLVNKDLEKGSISDYNGNKTLKQIQQNTSQYDNPILMIVTLKK